MNGTEKIVEYIKAEAEKKSSALLAAAEENCAGIRQEYQEKARERYTEKIREGVEAGQQRLEKLQSEKREESLRAVQELRASLVDKVLQQAAEKLGCEAGELKEKIKPDDMEKLESILFD